MTCDKPPHYVFFLGGGSYDLGLVHTMVKNVFKVGNLESLFITDDLFIYHR